ncbi:MAG: 2-oxo acid dehydrogenase subunit E2, partial [Candidatus Lokiarchaeota archaeon]|nr:2-oxo acid dehydrogenase subunit E2 [Candidatus Lokiarchaeota archaeon]
SFPRVRIAAVDLISQAIKQHNIHGLLEIDINKARRKIGDFKERTGEKLSFTSFIINCLAQAVNENKTVQAYRKGKKKLIIFEDVDVNTMIERDIEGKKMPWTYVVRAANKKSIKEIHYEIRNAQVEDIGITDLKKKMKIYSKVPKFIRNIFWWKYKRNPHLRKKMAGTVSITSIGMFGKKLGWGIPLGFHTLVITVGGIGEKPVLINEKIENHEFLSITVSFDHDIVDGAPAARFISRFTELVEDAYGLLMSRLI